MVYFVRLFLVIGLSKLLKDDQIIWSKGDQLFVIHLFLGIASC